MRSSKKRSRSSQNRPRTLGNIINRVFDSSGPEGKVRGTPQQIIEKYQMLARDAQLSNDRVAAENFLQHAEHYTRLLAEAMKEQAAEQEARQQQYQQSGGQSGGQNAGQNGGQNGNGGQNQPRGDRQDGQERRDRGDRDRGERQDRDRDRGQDRGPQDRGQQDRGQQERGQQDRGERRQDYNRDYREDRSFPAEEPVSATDVIDLDAGDDTGLIETPESSSRVRSEPVFEAVSEAMPEPESEAGAKEDRPRRPRGPRKPKGEKPDGEPPKEAAE